MYTATQSEELIPRPLPRGPTPEDTHLSSLHSEQILADAVDTAHLGTPLTVIVFGCTLGAVGLRRAETTVGHTEHNVRTCFLASIKKIAVIPIAGQ